MKLTVDGRHDEPNLSRVGGASEMGINLFGLMLIEGDESIEDVIAGGRIIRTSYDISRGQWLSLSMVNRIRWRTLVVGEILLHGTDG